MYLLRALIGSYDCLRLLWLVRVITLVLVLQHSNENRSNTKKYPSATLSPGPSPLFQIQNNSKCVILKKRRRPWVPGFLFDFGEKPEVISGKKTSCKPAIILQCYEVQVGNVLIALFSWEVLESYETLMVSFYADL